LAYEDDGLGGDLGGFATNLGDNFAGNVGIGNLIRGGVGANISNNQITGDFGGDVTFQGYVSTVDPATTVGTWTVDGSNPHNPANDVFGANGTGAGGLTTLNSYTQDPLSRFDLKFVGNTGDGAIVTRNDQNVDLYNNAEGTFKSRTNNANPPNGNGPFTSATRNRNATRLMGTIAQEQALGLYRPDPANPGSGNISVNHFSYSGVGDSAWRTTSLSTTSGFTSVPNGDFGNVGISIGGGVGEEPFDWGLIP
jgi:hypothetical protein